MAAGGSPLQNLVVRGHTDTMLSALRVEKGLDTGPIYAKRSMSLLGTAEEILLRATQLTEQLMVELVQNEPEPAAQEGEPTPFARRRPADGNVAQLSTLSAVHDFIRMLDADGYPPAFLETEFSPPGLLQGQPEIRSRRCRRDDLGEAIALCRRKCS